jgi:hypothetical protein
MLGPTDEGLLEPIHTMVKASAVEDARGMGWGVDKIISQFPTTTSRLKHTHHMV